MTDLLRLCTPFSVPVDMFAVVERKKLMCCLFKGKAPRLLRVIGVVKMDCLVRRFVEDRIKDARMSGFYSQVPSELGGFIRRGSEYDDLI